MTTFFVGQVDEVRPTSRKDKTTGQVQMSATLTATFETMDNEGYLNKSTENISFPIDLLGSLQSTKGKYIAIPYMYISTKSGNYLFPDDGLKFSVFDKHPFATDKK